MSTSQRSESMNKFFKDYLNSSTPMSVFVVQYDKAIDARYDKVREKDYKTKHSRPILKTLYPMEDEAAKEYTRKMFQIFQEELIQSQKFIAEKIEVKDGANIYKVHQLQRQRPAYIVSLDLALKRAVCSCHKFEFMGILCRHVLMVFIKKQIHSLPMYYLLDRWTRNATKEKANDPSNVTQTLKPSTLWFNNIMMHSIGLSERATKSEKHYQFAHQRLLQLCGELDELSYESEEDCVSGGQVSEKDQEINSCEQSQDVTLHDPPVATTKGRPRSLRMRGFLEVTQKTKKVSSPKIKRRSSQKQKRQTKSVKLKRKETSSNINAYSEFYQEYVENAGCAYATSFTDLMKAASTPFQQYRPKKQDGYNFIVLHIPMGRVQANNIDDLARLADEYGSRELRLTVEQNIISTTSIQFYGQDKSSSLNITEEVQKQASLMRLARKH
ncbi:protein FAR1-RELATED SEQUENCE 1-like [Solanum verrucosum]|uniref:protein FAR1-RELATED SEQUENCE 1-like n=1 Tax=Solanum verrucosum TaxID=315347 RepID=UPI0020D1A826|nr:protein FAR1-RELATED SEQUENCE 1-like [Solanum verrucosum]